MLLPFDSIGRTVFELNTDRSLYNLYQICENTQGGEE